MNKQSRSGSFGDFAYDRDPADFYQSPAHAVKDLFDHVPMPPRGTYFLDAGVGAGGVPEL